MTGGSVGLVFQHPEHQLLARTVRDEIAWGPRRARLPDVDERVSGAAGRVPPHRAGGPRPVPAVRRAAATAVARSDGGVRARRAAGGRADVRAGPPHVARACADALRRLADEGRGVVLVTHDLRLVGEVADDVLVLRDGHVLAHGPVDAVLADDALLARAGLPLPAVLAAWRTTGHPVRGMLARPARCRRLDGDAVPA